MKLKIEFEELRRGVSALNKANKGKTNVLVKMKAEKDNLILASTDAVAVKIAIPANVTEEGEFVTAFSDLNIVSIRKCIGECSICSTENNTVLIKYKGGMAKTVLKEVDDSFIDFPEPSDGAQKISLPMATLKDIAKTTVFATEDNPSSNLHSLKMDIVDDEDGLIKLVVTACDGKSLAVRTAYAAKNGNYTGSVLLLPESVKVAIDVIADAEDDVNITVDKDKVFMQQDGRVVSLRILDRQFPDMVGLLNKRKETTFQAELSKQELSDSLNCALYLQNAQKRTGFESSVVLSFANECISIGCINTACFNENIKAEITGDVPPRMYFNTALLKEVISVYPMDTLKLSGTNERSPLWLCSGDNDEYIFCVLPRTSNRN